jgi:Protein of unknown function (DUF2911)
MVKLSFMLAAVASFSNLTAQIKIPQESPAAKVQQQIGLSNVSITYGRPSLRGRKILGTEQVPYKKPWRMGADNATVLSFSDTVQINGTAIAPGDYLLAAIPDEKEWTIIINKKSRQWGLYAYNEKDDLLRFKVKPVKLSVPVETLKFEFMQQGYTASCLVMQWEKIRIEFLVTHNADARIKKEILSKTKNADSTTVQTLYDAANYYYYTNYDLEQALKWATQLVAKEPFYWRYIVQAKIAAKLKKYNVANTAAQKGLEDAVKDGDDAYVVAFKKILNEIKMWQPLGGAKQARL